MLNSKTLDDLAARIGKAFEGSPAKDIEKNVKAMLQSGLAKLDVVPRSEFDTQAQVLLKKYNFNGVGYTGNISKADQVTINNLATEFDNYNNDKPSACL